MKTKKIIIISIFITIFLICFILFAIITNKPKQGVAVEVKEDPIEINYTLQRVDIRNNYYAVKNCIEKFFTYCNEIDEVSNAKTGTETVQYSIQAIFNMLDRQYIDYKKITIENLLSKIDNNMVNKDIYIKNMYVVQRDENMSTYFVDIELKDKKTLEFSQVRIIVNVNMNNRTFKILLNDYVEEKYPIIEINQEIDMSIFKMDDSNIYNKFTFKNISDSEYIEDMFNSYKSYILFNKKEAFNILQEDYRKARFKNEEDFYDYVKKNTADNVTMELKEYQKNKFEDYNQYVCKDNKGNYLIFNEEFPMKYSIILDTYTIDTPQFIEKYNKANSMEKVGYNIQKCIEAVNNSDYNYVYSKLDTTFKESKYKTLESFEKVIKNNLFKDNIVGEVSTLNEGDTYVYKIEVKDSNDETKKTDMTIIMKLKEDRQFLMSFSF